jgi:hypothetical protein
MLVNLLQPIGCGYVSPGMARDPATLPARVAAQVPPRLATAAKCLVRILVAGRRRQPPPLMVSTVPVV